nr:bifunctional diguanylate cyclase/phosphodiesterase [Kineococcus aurantiacus]
MVDDLTGLPNRDALLGATTRALRGAGSGATAGPGLLVVDLDHFKDVNDTLGHPVGDALLREVAGRLAAQAPPGAVVARLGGDEFGLLVPDGLDAESLALAVVEEMSRPLRVGELQVLLPASVGVARAPEHGTSAPSLLKSADVALYHAKEVRGRACTYADRRDVNSIERLRLLGDLGRAVERGELFVRYQPQVDPRTGVVAGVEALVRWHHPELGAVGPDRFIPLAEQSGLVAGVTAVVLDRALADAARWRAEGHRPTVSVNLSARLLTDHDLPSMVAEGLRRHRVEASALVLEVTETGIVSDAERAGSVVRRLRALGCGVAVDDYGTGQCSLTYLTDLEVDELKIDRSFVTGMTGDRARAVIVRSTIQMARELGLRVVAEGVADAATLQVLATLGCHLAQGEHVGDPMSADAVTDLLRSRGGRRAAAVPGQSAPALEDRPHERTVKTV